MSSAVKLKKLEKNTAAVIFQTGLVEIGIGLVFVVSSLAMIFDDIRYYIDILFIVPVIFLFLAVKYIAEPRMGVVKYTKSMARKRTAMISAVTIFLIAMVTLTFWGGMNTVGALLNPRWIISGIIFIICTAIGYFMSFDRMYIYAFLLAGAFNLSEEIRENSWIISEAGYAYLTASLILIVIGSIYLIKFLKKYHLPDEGVTHDR